MTEMICLGAVAPVLSVQYQSRGIASMACVGFEASNRQDHGRPRFQGALNFSLPSEKALLENDPISTFCLITMYITHYR